MEKTKAKRIEDSITRLSNSEQIARKKASLLKEIYLHSLKDIRRDLEAFYKKYSAETGLSTSEIARTLGGVDLQTHVNKIQSLMSKIGISEDAYNKNLYAQITRLEALQEEVYWRIRSDVNKELRVHDETYSEIIKKNYLANSIVTGGLAGINKRALDIIVNDRWLGQNFSERCVLNNERVARQFSYLMGQQVVMGTGLSKLSRMLSQRNDIRLSEAQRLVRTEANNVHNQSDLQFYKDSGYTKYEFVATLDMHTSNICKKLDGQIFNTSDAVVGQNFPPMHPNCRSTTIAVVGDEESKQQVDDANKAQLDTKQTQEIMGNSVLSESLTQQDKDIIDYYTRHAGAYEMNAVLRGSIDANADDKRNIRLMDRAISKGKLRENIEVYRYISDASVFKNLSVGDIYDERAFMSTTHNEQTDREFDGEYKVKAIIKAPKGTEAIDVSTIYNRKAFKKGKEEDEIIFGRNQKLKLVSKDAEYDGMLYSTMSESEKMVYSRNNADRYLYTFTIVEAERKR